MNYKFLIIICVLSLLNVANCSTSSINDYKIDQVHIALHTPTSPKSGLLKEPLKIFDNISLKGDPVFIVDNEQVKSNLIKSLTFKYDDYFKFNSGGNSVVKVIPIDFITLLPTGFALTIENYSSGVATLRDKNKKYYARIDQSSFVLNGWPIDSLWPRDENRSSARKYISELMLKDKKFNKLITQIRLCIEKKSEECLASILNNSTDRFRGDITQLSIAKNDVLCTKMKSGIEISELTNQLETREVSWGLYQKAFSFKDYDTKYSILNSEFGKKITINLDLEGESYCDGKVKENFVSSFAFSNGDWDFYISQALKED
ncbi:MAG: hypothetical protein H7281_16130 [Bacteriovorax sp.]|nr:hypothetical protein [Bacteriovorax sp.]